MPSDPTQPLPTPPAAPDAAAARAEDWRGYLLNQLQTISSTTTSELHRLAAVIAGLNAINQIDLIAQRQRRLDLQERMLALAARHIELCPPSHRTPAALVPLAPCPRVPTSPSEAPPSQRRIAGESAPAAQPPHPNQTASIPARPHPPSPTRPITSALRHYRRKLLAHSTSGAAPNTPIYTLRLPPPPPTHRRVCHPLVRLRALTRPPAPRRAPSRAPAPHHSTPSGPNPTSEPIAQPRSATSTLSAPTRPTFPPPQLPADPGPPDIRPPPRPT